MTTREPKLTIRRAALSDLSDIMAIERVSFPTPWGAWFFRTEFVNPHGRLYLVAVLEETLVGYVGCRCTGNHCHIGTLAVAEAHRRRGIAEALLLSLLGRVREQRCKRVALEYRIRNYAAARLYEKMGFGQLKIRLGYYADTGEDAVEASVEDLTNIEWAHRLAQQWEAWRERHQYELEFISKESNPGH